MDSLLHCMHCMPLVRLEFVVPVVMDSMHDPREAKNYSTNDTRHFPNRGR